MRYIIGGYAPSAKTNDPTILQTGTVIGLNEWPKLGLKMDIWLGVDVTALMRDHSKMVRSIACQRYIQRQNGTEVPPGCILFERERETISTTWEGKLSWLVSSATAAMHLAGILGASEVLLYGVDYLGTGRADGGQSTDWDRYVKHGNRRIQELQAVFGYRVLKVNPESPLAVPTFRLA